MILQRKPFKSSATTCPIAPNPTMRDCAAKIKVMAISATPSVFAPVIRAIARAWRVAGAISTSILTPGTFMVCFPEDVHRTGMTVDTISDIRKLVIKVKV